MFYPKNSWKDYGAIPGVYTTGELSLVSSPLFRDHHLRLYRQRIFRVLDSDRFIIVSYLIVKEHAPVMVFKIDPDHIAFNFFRDKRASQIPVYPIYDRDMAEGQVDELLSHLEPLLKNSDRPCQTSDTYVPVPPEHHETMARLRMIRKQTDHIWLPTNYGNSLGLIDGYMIQNDGQPLHTFFIPPEHMAELHKAMTWDQTCWEEPKTALSLEQRLEKARQGLPGSNANTVGPVRAFGAMPMSDYMAPYPEYAEELRQKFGETTTFQEAADRVFQFCMKPNNRDACTELIATLILPLISIHNGETPVNRATKPVRDLLRRPFPSVLLGTAMAAGQPCLLRNTQRILDEVLDGNADKLSTSCWTLVCNLHTIGEKKGTDMLFRLFVEPFALLNQSVNTPYH